jgi:hypothetical protein
VWGALTELESSPPLPPPSATPPSGENERAGINVPASMLVVIVGASSGSPHCPFVHVASRGHFAPLQASTQRPIEHALPLGHVTPAQPCSTQRPLLDSQSRPLAQPLQVHDSMQAPSRQTVPVWQLTAAQGSLQRPSRQL